jgi:hypothetical protein
MSNPCDPQVFSGVSSAQFDCLVREAAAQNIAINGNQGTTVISHGPVHAEISWNFDRVSQTLTLQYLNPGLLAGCDKVDGMLKQLVASCQ